MTDVQVADKRTESPLGRYSRIKYTYGRDDQGNLVVYEEEQASTMPRMGKPKHQDFWDARKNLDYVRRFMNSHGASEWAGLASVLEVVAQTIPPWVVLPDDIGDYGSLNAITGLCAGSGGGKTTAEKLGRRALVLPTEDHLLVKVIGTGEGIPKIYGDYVTIDKVKSLQYERWSVLQSAADVDSLYAQMQRSGATLGPVMLAAWDGGDLGAAIAGKDNRVPIGSHRYRWGLIVGIQFLRSQVLLDSEASGLMQRIMLWPTAFTDRIDRSAQKLIPLTFDPPDCEWPFDRTDDGAYDQFLQDMGKPLPVSSMSTISIPRAVLDDCDEFDYKKRNGQFSDPLDHHLNLMRLKLAVRFMWFDGRAEMNDEDWQLAGYVIDRIHKPTRDQLREGAEQSRRDTIRQRESDRALVKNSTDVYAARVAKLADHLYERVHEKVGAGQSITGGELTRSIKRKELPDAIDLLVSSGKWVKEPTGTNRGGWRYRRS